jgi:superfamily II DNA or RNA helicase/HKD family nuclease
MADENDDWFGLHERLDTPRLRRELQRLGLEDLAVWRKKLDAEELPAAVSAHLGRALAQLMLDLRDRDREAWHKAVSAFSGALEESGHPLADLVEFLPSLPFRQLMEVREPEANTVGAAGRDRPDIPLSLSALLTGSRQSPSLVSQIEKELVSCDRADWLVSFIKFSGIRALKPALQRFVETPLPDGSPRLRVATTSYLGATDLKAIKTLLDLPNTEVRVSYDTHRTRLHAKAYLFHRHTGFGTAYVGSANVSRIALDEGLEWTARISQHELPYLWRQILAGFDTHWSDPAEFELVTWDDLDRLDQALQAERNGPTGEEPPTWQFFELQPYGFQQEILDAIEAERSAGIARHLVIAATGTGKTMLAAFDYRRLARRRSDTNRPRLLFIAHREEILKQALNTFRHVLRDGEFGDLLVGGRRPTQSGHIFCSVQSWNARGLDELSPDHFDYVVLDEAHHAAADSYQSILNHVRPKVLLGLTATPERTDGEDIRSDFGGSFTHEMRLPDAIEARRLAPFHYFGIGDEPGVDLSGLRWQSGGYRKDDLNRVIGTNERRARWVLNNLIDHVAEPEHIRGLGFCVSQEHAEFMERFFTAHGMPSVALTAHSPDALRRDAQRKLVQREIRLIFTVDLFNEGVDIPEVDTVMMLRPTESLTVFLQQLGRGLRLHEEKPHLTVLDFIAPQHRRFRFADRYRALSAKTEARVDDQIERGLPWLPAGCLMRLDRQAMTAVLDNIRSALAQRRPQIVEQLQSLLDQAGARPSLQQMLDWLHFDDADLLLKHGLPCRLLEQAGGESLPPALEEYEKGLAGGLQRLLIADDRQILQALSAAVGGQNGKDPEWRQRLILALALIWGTKRPNGGDAAALAFLHDSALLAQDVLEVVEWRLRQLIPAEPRRWPQLSGVLALHAHYTREQILLALGKGSFEKPAQQREGVLHVPDAKLDVFFVTINKSEKEFSPSTLYEDYALSDRLFHWQSQSTTSAESPTGRRYINHRAQGYQPLLFVRSNKTLSNGLTAPFQYLGPVEYVRHEGSRPMSIVWRLHHPLPAQSLRQFRQEAI